jgi:hypothetical protein
LVAEGGNNNPGEWSVPIDVDDPSPVVREDQGHEQQPVGDRWHDEASAAVKNLAWFVRKVRRKRRSARPYGRIPLLPIDRIADRAVCSP